MLLPFWPPQRSCEYQKGLPGPESKYSLVFVQLDGAQWNVHLFEDYCQILSWSVHCSCRESRKQCHLHQLGVDHSMQSQGRCNLVCDLWLQTRRNRWKELISYWSWTTWSLLIYLTRRGHHRWTINTDSLTFALRLAYRRITIDITSFNFWDFGISRWTFSWADHGLEEASVPAVGAGDPLRCLSKDYSDTRCT